MLFVLGIAGACACALGDILAPGPGTLVVGALVSLAILPADTVLVNPGDGFCYRTEARDSAGTLVTGLTPAYTVTEGAALVEVTDDGCVVALSSSASPARVVGRIGALTAMGTVRVPGPGATLVATLEIAPADTTLVAIGDRACYTWIARDALGAELNGIEPTFVLRSNPGQRLSQGPEPNCFSVASVGVVNAIVDATADTVTASATLRIRP